MDKFKVIDGYDCENNQCKLIENTDTGEQYNTENQLEAESLCELLNRQAMEIKVLKNKVEYYKDIVEHTYTECQCGE